MRDRRALAVVGSGALIAAALAAWWGAGHGPAGNALMAAAAVVAGSGIAVRAWRALRGRHVGIELLVTIAAVGAIAIGDYWEAAAVTFLFAVGGYLESRSMRRTRRALGELLELAPSVAVVDRGAGWVEVPHHEVRSGELVLVRPGGRIPVDGEVEDGGGAVDQSMVTGEPCPAEKHLGDPVYAGTVSLGGMLTVRATGVGADTTLARIVRRVEEAQDERAPTQRFIDRFARWYTPSIVVLAGAAFLTTGDLRLALTLLVIACPGALVISTPVSIVSGIGRAARDGILVKGGQHLESIARITAVAADKTGTLTRGRPVLQQIVALEPAETPAGHSSASAAGEPWTDPRWTAAQRDVLRLAAIAEGVSEHPLAAPVLEALGAGETRPRPDRFWAVPGKGVRATLEGREIVVGNRRMMGHAGARLGDDAMEALERIRERGATPVVVAVDGRVRGALGFADTPRPDAKAMVAGLRTLGVRRIVMLTGDEARAAHTVAAEVGIDAHEVHAGLLPDEKLDRVKALQRAGERVAMVGDGINDAPALAAADVSIAMGAAGADLAIETADLALMSDDLRRIPEAIGLARRTIRNMRQNLAVALVTVVALLGGVLAGEVHMAGGMLVHQLSVLAVIGNGMRLMR